MHASSSAQCHWHDAPDQHLDNATVEISIVNDTSAAELCNSQSSKTSGSGGVRRPSRVIEPNLQFSYCAAYARWVIAVRQTHGVTHRGLDAHEAWFWAPLSPTETSIDSVADFCCNLSCDDHRTRS